MCAAAQIPRRHVSSWLRSVFGRSSTDATSHTPTPLPSAPPSLSSSPHADLRCLGRDLTEAGACRVCQQHGVDAKPVFACPQCGFPSHCSAEHHARDIDHDHVCERLRTLSMDLHDLRSARPKRELDFAALAVPQHALDLTCWQGYARSRGIWDADNPRTLRHVSRALTFPLTIAHVLRQPCSLAGATQRGQHVLASLASQASIAIYVLGARAEAGLPPSVWSEMAHVMPHQHIDIVFIGPDVPAQLDGKTHSTASDRITLHAHRALLHQLSDEQRASLPPASMAVAFNSGLSHPVQQPSWQPTLALLHHARTPVLLTSFDAADATSDASVLEQPVAMSTLSSSSSLSSSAREDGVFSFLVQPSLNPFRSLSHDVSRQDVHHLINSNQHLMMVIAENAMTDGDDAR